MFAHSRGFLRWFCIPQSVLPQSLRRRAAHTPRHKNRLLLKPHRLMTNLYFDTAKSKFFLFPPFYLLQITESDCSFKAVGPVRKMLQCVLDGKQLCVVENLKHQLFFFSVQGPGVQALYVRLAHAYFLTAVWSGSESWTQPTQQPFETGLESDWYGCCVSTCLLFPRFG